MALLHCRHTLNIVIAIFFVKYIISFSFLDCKNDLYYCDSLHHTNSTLSYHVANEHIWRQKFSGKEILSAYPNSNQRIPSYHLRRPASRVCAGIQSLPSVFQEGKERFCEDEHSKSIMGSAYVVSSTTGVVSYIKC